MIVLAADGSTAGHPDGFQPIPVAPTLHRSAEPIARPYDELSFLGLVRNSLVVAGSSALASLVLVASMADALARMRFPGQRAALVAFLLGYTEFVLAWLFIHTDTNGTLAMVLAEATTGVYSANWGLTAAHALLMTVPVVAVFLVLQRALLRGAPAWAAGD
ncbi:MAG: hypothetical protein WCK58_06880 [Chloroflexota bacterium]